MSPNITMEWRGGGAKMSQNKFVLVMSLEKVNKSFCHITQGGEGEEEMTPNVTKGEGV